MKRKGNSPVKFALLNSNSSRLMNMLTGVQTHMFTHSVVFSLSRSLYLSLLCYWQFDTSAVLNMLLEICDQLHHRQMLISSSLCCIRMYVYMCAVDIEMSNLQNFSAHVHIQRWIFNMQNKQRFDIESPVFRSLAISDLLYFLFVWRNTI